MPPTVFTLPQALRSQMIAHAQACLPEEACGLVGGLAMLGRVYLPITNQLHSPTQFFMEPREMLAALNQLDALGLQLLAIAHSHPGGPAGPSASDIAQFAWPGVLTLILSPAGAAWQIQACQIEDGRAHPVQMDGQP